MEELNRSCKVRSGERVRTSDTAQSTAVVRNWSLVPSVRVGFLTATSKTIFR